MKRVITFLMVVLLCTFCSTYNRVINTPQEVSSIDTLTIEQIDSALKSYNIILSPSESVLVKDTTYSKDGDEFLFDNGVSIKRIQDKYILNRY